MFKKIFLVHPVIMVLMALLACLVCLPTVHASQGVGIKINGNVLETDPAPFRQNNSVMVPVRQVADVLGAEVWWDEERQTVTVTKENCQMELSVGKNQAVIKGQEVQTNTVPVIIDDRVIIPIRLLAEGLQLSITWDDTAQIVNVGKPSIVAGSSLDFPPFDFKENLAPVGFEMDLIKAIAEVSGQAITIEDISFDQLIPALRSGQVDLIISGLTITEQRKEFISFTNPYYTWEEAIVTQKGGSDSLTLEDLADKKIAVQKGSSEQQIIDDFVKEHPATQVTSYDTLEQVWSSVEKGEMDAAVASYPLTAYYLKNYPASNLQIAGKTTDGQPMGIAVQKDDKELLNQLNAALEKIIKNGTYDRIYDQWFGSVTQEESAVQNKD